MRAPERSSVILAALIAVLAAAVAPVDGVAQLLSPGALVAPHAELEGIRRCTLCHELGTRGVRPERCLACHEPLARRVAEQRGYHASVSDDCAQCHKDHLGRDFDLRRLDEEAFDHRATGWPFEPGHGQVSCRACHAPDRIVDAEVRAFKDGHGALGRTFLGLDGNCASCHEEDSPHGPRLDGRGCADCHDASVWTEAVRFDHDATAYALEGRHRDVICASCHGGGEGEAWFEPLAHDTCTSCHEDEHGGAMGAGCERCHTTRGWGLVAGEVVEGRFDHARTAFALRGAHARAACADCHRSGRPPSAEGISMRYVAGTEGRTYPRPRADSCASCHVDRHEYPNAEGRWTGCGSCHEEEAWGPTDFGLARHDAEAAFALEGAHRVVPCVRCHVDSGGGSMGFVLAVAAADCATCHREDDPHDGAYAPLDCARCHDVDAFEEARFGHAVLEELGRGESCRSCHAPDDPHAGQFADRDCANCHGTERFTIDAFDHGTTRFVLEGAHGDLSCAACHVPEPIAGSLMVRYTPLPTDCVACHGATP